MHVGRYITVTSLPPQSRGQNSPSCKLEWRWELQLNHSLWFNYTIQIAQVHWTRLQATGIRTTYYTSAHVANIIMRDKQLLAGTEIKLEGN